VLDLLLRACRLSLTAQVLKYQPSGAQHQLGGGRQAEGRVASGAQLGASGAAHPGGDDPRAKLAAQHRGCLPMHKPTQSGVQLVI
jgi:hypothetical protein